MMHKGELSVAPVLLRKRQAAAMLQFSERGLDPLLLAGLLRVRRIGPRCIRFLASDVEACAQSLGETSVGHG